MNKMKFALAGEIVSTSKDAHRIWLKALRSGSSHIVPQALSVQRQLKAAGQ